MLILPKPAPDELAHGYWGRLHQLNLMASPNETLRALAAHFGSRSGSCRTILTLASAAGISAQAFVQGHTLIPATLAISTNSPGRIHGHGLEDGHNLLQPFQLAKSSAYFCPSCIEEQRQHTGMAYWKRVHQLPGIDWCPTHHETLLSDKSTAFRMRNPTVANALTIPTRGVTTSATTPAMERYAQIMAGFLLRHRRLAPGEGAKAIRPVAHARGFRIGNVESVAPYLSDVVLEYFPRWWLERLFPTLPTKARGKAFPAIDNTVYLGQSRPHCFALAMAMLFATSEEALAAWPE